MYRKYGKSSTLMAAIAEHDMTRVKALLDGGVDADEPDEQGWRPLHLACSDIEFEGAIEIVGLLIERGADVNAWDLNYNETPILVACDPPNRSIVYRLLEAGADPNARRSDGESPLRLCAGAQDLELAGLLLLRGATETINDYGGILGLTALAIAAGNYDVPMIELLIRAGADPSRLEEFGETARDKLPPREARDPQEWDRVMELLGRYTV